MAYEPTREARPEDAPDEVRALILRQARAWEAGDFDLAAGDWLPDGVLVSPGGTWRVAELRAEMAKLHAHYRDLRVSVKNLFTSADGSVVSSPSSGTGP